MTDDHHDNRYEDDGEIHSVLAHIAYAGWRGPEHDGPADAPAGSGA